MLIRSHKHLRQKSSASNQKSELKSHTRATSDMYQLSMLKGKDIIKAPKIYQNQIFRDIYDKEGNHDRLLDTSNISDTAPRVIFQWNLENSGNKENKIEEYFANIEEKTFQKPIQEIHDLIKLPALSRHDKIVQKKFFS